MPEVAWILPPPLQASGGIATVVRKAKALAGAGWRSTFHVMARVGPPPTEAAADPIGLLTGEYGIERARIADTPDPGAGYDAVIATAWGTVPLAAAAAAPVRLQFVQDIEPLFTPAGDRQLAWELATFYGLPAISLGRWLAHALRRDYDVEAHAIDFGADTGLYRPDPAVPREDAVCFVYQPGKAHRCALTGLAALRLLKKFRPQTTIYTFGHHVAPQVDFDLTHLGILAPAALAQLYRRCRAGFCLSLTNPSRIPFEMLAAGLPVVEAYRHNTILDLPEEGTVLAFPSAPSIAAALFALVQRPDFAAKEGADGARFMAARDLTVEDAAFVRAFQSVVAGQAPQRGGAWPAQNGRPVVHSLDDGPGARRYLDFQRRLVGAG